MNSGKIVADGRDGKSKVLQEVLADLKIKKKVGRVEEPASLAASASQPPPPEPSDGTGSGPEIGKQAACQQQKKG